MFESLFSKVAGIQISTQVFSREICKMFKNAFFTEHVQWLLLDLPNKVCYVLTFLFLLLVLLVLLLVLFLITIPFEIPETFKISFKRDLKD